MYPFKCCLFLSFQVISGNDPLDSKDFNPVDYINTLFPTEQVKHFALIFFVLTQVGKFVLRAEELWGALQNFGARMKNIGAQRA